MAIEPADLLDPKGMIERSTFSEDESTLNDRLQAYIDDGVSRTQTITDPDKRDYLVSAWAYFRAFTAAAQQLAGTLSGKIGPADFTVTGRQIDFFNNLAATWYGKYTETISPTSEAVSLPRSTSVPTEPTW